MSELDRLRNALKFLTQHLPGATELAEIAENGRNKTTQKDGAISRPAFIVFSQ